jgi:thioredoxin-like negative regulator of GroEL
VQLLTTANFRALTSRETRGARVVLLEFFQNTCGACRELHAPLLAKLAEQLRGAALVAAVDCSPGAPTEKICAAQKVAAFPTLRLLFEGGSADVPDTELRSEAKLRNLVLAKLPANKVALTDGDGPASRRKLDSLARRCDVALAAASAAAAATAAAAPPSAAGGARSRGSMGCAVLFSDKKEPAPMWAALSLAAEFDATRAEAANASSVDDKKVTPAQLPGFVFVFAQTAKGDGGVGVKPGVAADLGVRALPAVALLHGSSLADFELRELRDADVAAGKRRRFGEAEAIADTEGRVRGRRLLDAAAVGGGFEPLRAALLEHQRAVGLAVRTAARIAAKRAQAAGVRAPSHDESVGPAVEVGSDEL